MPEAACGQFTESLPRMTWVEGGWLLHPYTSSLGTTPIQRSGWCRKALLKLDIPLELAVSTVANTKHSSNSPSPALLIHLLMIPVALPNKPLVHKSPSPREHKPGH